MVYEISTAQAKDGGFGRAYWTHKFARSKDLSHWESIEEPLLVLVLEFFFTGFEFHYKNTFAKKNYYIYAFT